MFMLVNYHIEPFRRLLTVQYVFTARRYIPPVLIFLESESANMKHTCTRIKKVCHVTILLMFILCLGSDNCSVCVGCRYPVLDSQQPGRVNPQTIVAHPNWITIS